MSRLKPRLCQLRALCHLPTPLRTDPLQRRKQKVYPITMGASQGCGPSDLEPLSNELPARYIQQHQLILMVQI